MRRHVKWAEPRTITDVGDCYWYHTMELPGVGVVQGEWDLRGKEAAYLGDIELRGKKVLEIGTASGHLCFTMERMGAEVVAHDLSDEQEWDIVPYAGYDYQKHISERKKHVKRINDSFWFAHRAYKSRAKVLYGTVYEIPEDIGQFDVCTFGSVLLHLRDPFLALQRVVAHVTESVVITDGAPDPADARLFGGRRLIEFLPNGLACVPTETWWKLSPEVVSEFLQVLGFAVTKVSYLKVEHRSMKVVQLYTVVGHRKESR